MNDTITAVPGIEAGHYTDARHATGCTVILCRTGATGGVDVRGGSPGTRETDLLRPMNRVDRAHAIVLSGGSAFGLESASGVMRYLAQQGIGVKAGPALVPIVASAILFDLGLITSNVYPGVNEGYAACQSASSEPMPEGSVGAGTGATVAKLRGLDWAVKGGIGSARLALPGGVTVAAAVAVNAYGGITDYQTGQLVAGVRRKDGLGFDDPIALLLRQGASRDGAPLTNTTIGVVATNATLTREDANLLARISHDGQALCIRPCHTNRDGDTMFVLATGLHPGPVDFTTLGAAAVEVTARAILRAIYTATGLGGVPSISELANV